MEVPKQCSTKHVISSLLFKDCYFPVNLDIVENVYEENESINQKESNQMMDVLESAIKTIPQNEHKILENETDKLSSQLNDIKQNYLGLKENIKLIQMDFVKVSGFSSLELKSRKRFLCVSTTFLKLTPEINKLSLIV